MYQRQGLLLSGGNVFLQQPCRKVDLMGPQAHLLASFSSGSDTQTGLPPYFTMARIRQSRVPRP